MIPARITELSALERGDKLVIDFIVPETATDGVTLHRLSDVDVRVGPEDSSWESAAKRIETGASKPGPVHIEVGLREWIGRDIEVRARAAGRPGRFSEWSNSAKLKVVPALEKPVLKVEAVPHGVQLEWTPEPVTATEYRVLKQGPAEQQPVVIATVKVPEYVDPVTEYGKRYEYSVQAFLKAGEAEAQSDVSQSVPITPEDRFPPPVPTGVTAIAGISAIELSWNPDSDPDLQGYYVYRTLGDGPFARLGELVQTPAYSDHAIESGKRYRYAISAVSLRGHESQRSAPAEVTAP